jgi:hypothetical protein
VRDAGRAGGDGNDLPDVATGFGLRIDLGGGGDRRCRSRRPVFGPALGADADQGQGGVETACGSRIAVLVLVSYTVLPAKRVISTCVSAARMTKVRLGEIGLVEDIFGSGSALGFDADAVAHQRGGLLEGLGGHVGVGDAGGACGDCDDPCHD